MHMNKYVVDSYSWIDYFDGNKQGKKVREFLESKNNEIITNILTLSEIISVFKRRGYDYDKAFEKIINLSKLYINNVNFSKEVGLLHAEIKTKIKDFGLADAFVLLTARKLNAKILTGDPHFKNFKETIMV